MQFLILGLLLHGPLSVYDLRKRFAAGIALFHSAVAMAYNRTVADGPAS